MSTQNVVQTTKKILFNINYDLNAGGVRQLEIDAFKCLNSNINNLGVPNSPIDGTATKTDATLFFARNRLIKLIDIWNRILNSGLFTNCTIYATGSLLAYKIVGSNIPLFSAEYLFKSWDNASTNIFPLDLATTSIFYRIVRFITASTNNYNWFKTNNVGKQSFFALTNSNVTWEMDYYINVNYNPDNATFIGLMNELLDVVKDLLDETKVAALGFDFSGLDFGTTQGRTNILALDAYKSNYKALARIDTSYLNDETKVLAQEWITTNSNKTVRLYPQFGSLISRNTENEPWSFRNVAIDTSVYNPFDLNPTLDPALKPYQTKYLLCSQLDMKKPLVFETQFINWNNENDRPYVMLYNGSTLVYIPDEIKDQSTLNTLGEQPDNQLNLCAYFWKIGTSSNLDPHYNKYDDIKLKLPDTLNLYDIDKIDFLDNLTLYLKIN